MRRNILNCIALILVTNLLTMGLSYYFIKDVEFIETSKAYEEMIAKYAIYLDENKSKPVQKMMLTPLFLKISTLGKEDSSRDDFTYLCSPWNQDLNKVIKTNLLNKKDFLLIDDMNRTYQNYLYGTEKLDKWCKH